MQGHNTADSKVVSLFESRSKSKEENADTAQASSESKAEETPSFQDVMKQNQKNKERLERERLSANKSVLRSYRIKH